MAKIAVLSGDGVGPEVVREAMKVLEITGARFGIPLEFEEGIVGGAAIDREGTPLPLRTLSLCKACDAILFGAVGGPKWDSLPVDRRPERGLLLLRKELGLYANLRPVKLFAPLVDASPLKREIIEGVDLMVLRELTGGLYFGEPKGIDALPNAQGERAVDTLIYTTPEIERIARIGFQIAAQRRKRLTSVDKVNVLASSQLWRRVVTETAKEFPGIELDHMLVDNCSMQLIRDPRQFDVLLTENTFGDILSDEAAMLAGSIGMLPSASLGDGPGLYEPIHGSAPDIAGQDTVNPLATILSAAMLLRYSLHHELAAAAIETAVSRVLEAGYRTPDIWQPGPAVLVNTAHMGDLVVESLVKG
ncbi:3-isopropylmalate dehydrogenase [Candidatus Methylomirabilis limnetica]|uniref:3-isopropylmalate dehydrogenase n=1 Tax=Candidatus Methylomirabilis limnetica TaxID=2033718 RepID=A0A2T4TX99_9BACT|nr:3-isopropylmalate dehydrogenase [Candidatus Methylomirabilis limnetica]PTL35744.1 3-isopropylmalate dehydrogenase [Candidatus Methylomirabilis limnetica]